MNATVHLRAHAYKKFLQFALEHAHPHEDRTNWQEVLAVLLGRFNDDSSIVEVTDVIPLAVGSGYHVEAHDYTKIFSVLSPERLEQGEVIVGWIHTHPGLGLFLSSTDVHTQSLYQRLDPRSIAIVCDPTKTTARFPGMRAFRVTDIGGPFSNRLQEIPISIIGLQPPNFSEVQQSIVRSLIAKKAIPIPSRTARGEVVRRLYIGPDELLRAVKLAKHQNQYVVNLQWICPHPNQTLSMNVRIITPTNENETDWSLKTSSLHHASCFSSFCQNIGLESHVTHVHVMTPSVTEWPPPLLMPLLPIATWLIPEEIVSNVRFIISMGLKSFPPLIVT